jgi:CheY-like chemotaxis protein
MEADMGARAKVLMIDDDQDYRNSVRCLLETQGYEVIEADCGKEGLRKVVEHKPDVILLDVMMECASEGYGITQAIKHQDAFADCRNIPIIMVSSIQESPDELFPMAPESEMIRPDRYIAKPLDARVLLEALAKALGPKRSQTVPAP